ncbi:ferritin [Alkalihalobacillus pseudalcaliphilus]|uniref:ferritin n=1 Tax=Alkalihalobacillus pseudalcaliphilus TaxID=79884 RepID=UPI00064E0F51|nr:ferritin [Alkalihalobacillus pseudalcaliphilus]KMK75236.1 ferritin [Alkalihalobacillus pseudalcaliphilus]
MLSEKLVDALNHQMNIEFQAAHDYMAMAAYCHYTSYDGFANFFLMQAQEEREHGMKVYTYLNDKGKQALFADVKAPKAKFNTLLETFEAALEQEKKVTKSYYDVYGIAQDEREYQTLSFLNWFLDEQVEEESMFETHIDYLKRIQDDSNALYIYEQELGKRKAGE